jgi:hypothetical protein
MPRPSLIKASRDAIKDNPKEIFNLYLIACTCVWSFSGVAKGFDEGVLLIITAQPRAGPKYLTRKQAILHPQ